jgi:hypothetical protein
MNSSPSRGGDLRIDRETILCELPRGDRGETLRLTFSEGTTGDGKKVAWHSLREFYTDDTGKRKPGKKGITIRGRELKPVVEALAKAVSGRQTS